MLTVGAAVAHYVCTVGLKAIDDVDPPPSPRDDRLTPSFPFRGTNAEYVVAFWRDKVVVS